MRKRGFEDIVPPCAPVIADVDESPTKKQKQIVIQGKLEHWLCSMSNLVIQLPEMQRIRIFTTLIWC